MPYELKLNDGIIMPTLGLGVFGMSLEDTFFSVKHALEVGYRLIDTASRYNNESSVGSAIATSHLLRDDVFIITKAWPSSYADIRYAIQRSLKRLHTDYIDLYLLHWPTSSDFRLTIKAYLEANSLLKEGKIRTVGLSNFNGSQLSELISSTQIIPSVNQVEIHPYLNQQDLINIHRQYGIVSQAWSPIGGVLRNHPRFCLKSPHASSGLCRPGIPLPESCWRVCHSACRYGVVP